MGTVRLVVACSGPFQGSHLLWWLRPSQSDNSDTLLVRAFRKIACWFVDLNKQIFKDLSIDSKKLAQIQNEMLAGKTCYRCITGKFDPLVLPKSASYNGTGTGESEVIIVSHCGH